ncbi:MAG: type IV toxin-antitoxin system AbiEi family antitoxin domain-containing protein [Bdellovibrionia bacterium]
MKKIARSKGKIAAEELFRKRGGILRASEAFEEGIYPRDLYALRDDGVIKKVARGLFRLKALPLLQSPELLTVAAKIPRGVLCMTSALFFHGVIENAPFEIHVALKKGSEKPRIAEIPIKFCWISEPIFSEGIEIRSVENIDLRVYSVEKALVDCFKFRRYVGMTTCLAALQTWSKLPDKKVKHLLAFAKSCRVETIIRPYLEAFLIQTDTRDKP